MAQKLPNLLVQLFAATLPFQVLGVFLGSYPFGLPLVFLLALNIALLSTRRFLTTHLLLFGIWLLWCIATVILRQPVSAYLMSLLALIVVVLPLLVSWEGLDQRRLFVGLLIGLALSLVAATYDLGVSLLGWTPLELILPSGLAEKAGTQELIGFRRVKALMLEPAHYALYLVFSYVLLDQFGHRYISRRVERLFKVGVVYGILLTLSLSGTLLWITYFLMALFLRLRRASLTRARLVVAACMALAMPLLAFALYLNFSEVIDLYVERIELTIYAVRHGVFKGSVGSRANAIPVMVNYWTSEGTTAWVAGEGYANYEAWLIANFAHLGVLSSFARGDIANTFAAVGISTGVFGLGLYLAFIGLVVRYRRARLPLVFVVVWLLANFAYGQLIGYLLWSMLLLGRLFVWSPHPGAEKSPLTRPAQ